MNKTCGNSVLGFFGNSDGIFFNKVAVCSREQVLGVVAQGGDLLAG